MVRCSREACLTGPPQRPPDEHPCQGASGASDRGMGDEVAMACQCCSCPDQITAGNLMINSARTTVATAAICWRRRKLLTSADDAAPHHLHMKPAPHPSLTLALVLQAAHSSPLPPYIQSPLPPGDLTSTIALSCASPSAPFASISPMTSSMSRGWVLYTEK